MTAGDRFAALVPRLKAALAEPLPGPSAQRRFAPQPRREWPAGTHPADARHAAALVLLFPIEGHAHLPLTLRADTLGRHGGQISFPGGVIDPGETHAQAALREAHEEIGLSLDAVQLCGSLTPIDIPVSGFRLHPIVAVTLERPMFTAADGEVAQILEVPVARLLEPACQITTTRVHDGGDISVPAFQLGDAEVWGATAMVLAELLALPVWR